MADHTIELTIFTALFLLIAVMGFAAARWKPGETMHHLDEWGLGGRKFGTWVSWFLIGGDLYTAYTFVAVPALMFGAGAIGFFAVPYTIVLYPLVFLVLIRLWSVSHRHGFVTSADFVRARFDSRGLALVISLTGLVATMPYVALQLVGVQAVLATMGVSGKWPLVLAFLVLALFTYSSGLRAPALIAFVKDTLIYIVIIVAVIYIPTQLGGFDDIFAATSKHFEAAGQGPGPILGEPSQMLYITLALGSALALMLYPHSTTAILAAKSRDVVKRNMALLPLYSLMLGFLSLLGFFAIAAKVEPVGGDANTIVPALFDQQFSPWFAGIAFAAIGIGALVPAAIMSIAAANTFTRNIYKEFFRPNATPKEETAVAKIVSLVVKFGALGFIIFLNPSFAIDLQLIGGVIILQTLPAVGIGLFTRWFHRGGLIAGWAVGMSVALVLLYQIPKKDASGAVLKEHFGGSGYPLANFGFDTQMSIWAGFIAIAANLVIAVVVTMLLNAMKVSGGVDRTQHSDYFAELGDPEVKDIDLAIGAPKPDTVG